LTAGYSGTPLAKKLGIKDGSRVLLRHAPPDFPALLAPLPEEVKISTAMRGTFDVIVCFSKSAADLSRSFDGLVTILSPGGGLWIAWPKKASKMATDLTEDVLREIVLPRGLVDNKVCAIDETWSGLRFMRRRAPPASPAKAPSSPPR
jgi:hypothetical protein